MSQQPDTAALIAALNDAANKPDHYYAMTVVGLLRQAAEALELAKIKADTAEFMLGYEAAKEASRGAYDNVVAERDALRQALAQERDALYNTRTHLIQQQAENKRLRAALAFYAEPESWSIDGTFVKADESGARADAGKRARQELARRSPLTRR